MIKIKQIDSLQAILNAKAAKANVTGATKTKITYNDDGIVTGGTDLAAGDIPNIDASKITSGELASARLPVVPVTKGGTGRSSLTSDNYIKGAGTSQVTLIAKTSVKADIGLGNVSNNPQVKKAGSSTIGKLPKWSVTSGDEIVDGYGVLTEVRADGTAADVDVPTEKAVRDAINAALASADAMSYQGAIDASGNPNYPAADAGDTYKISTAGKIGGASGRNVGVGDILICVEDGTPVGTESTVGIKWNVIHVNREGEVIGPNSSTNNHIAVFDGVTGALIKDGGTTIAAIQAGATTQRQDDLTGQDAPPNTELTITGGLNATPLSGSEPILTINGLVIQRGNYASLDTHKWAFSGQNIKLKMSYAIETDDTILVNYNY
jgi:hypothetical protein